MGSLLPVGESVQLYTAMPNAHEVRPPLLGRLLPTLLSLQQMPVEHLPRASAVMFQGQW